jgi:DNA-binding transcriptional regulator YbjK
MSSNAELTVVSHYLDRYLKRHDDSAFHSLRDFGEKTVIVLRSRFSAVSIESKVKMLILARDIREDSATQFLVEAAAEKQSAIWKPALEGLMYQSPPHLMSLLEELLATSLERAENDKAEYLRELLREVANQG